MALPLIGIFHITIAVVCSYFLLNTLVNLLYLRLFSRRPQGSSGPHVSIMVPARNEEKNIEECLRTLLAQNYENYEVLVMDDSSEDRTGEIIDALAKEFPSKLRSFHGGELREGWYGKPYALQRLAEKARGEYFLFTDADTSHSPDSVAYCVTNALHYDLDLLSAYPRELIHTFGEVINVSAMYLMTAIVLPLPAIDLLRWKQASFCLGQYFFVKREAFQNLGGFDLVKHEITEDVAFGKALKQRGYKTKFLDAQPYVSCRMYKTFPESFRGIGKNVYSSVGRNGLLILGIATLIFGFIDYPLVRLIYELFTTGQTSPPILLSVLLFTTMWALNLLDRKVPFFSLPLYPLVYTNIFVMALFYSVRFRFGKGITWKGRKYDG